MAQIIRLLIVDDHPTHTEGLVALFKEEPDIEVVGWAANGQAALEMALDLEPDVVLMDMEMPVMNGLEATRRILKHLPNTKILVFTMHNLPEYSVQAMQAGAIGFASKGLSFAALLPMVKVAYAGGSIFPPTPPPVIKESPKMVLTETEARVFVLMVQGVERRSSYQKLTSSGAIAKALDMATRTVEAHRASIREKLGNLTPLEMVSYARKHGLIDDDLI